MAPHVQVHVYWRQERPVSAALLPLLYRYDGAGPPAIKPLPAFGPAEEAVRHGDCTLEDKPLSEGLRLCR